MAEKKKVARQNDPWQDCKIRPGVLLINFQLTLSLQKLVRSCRAQERERCGAEWDGGVRPAGAQAVPGEVPGLRSTARVNFRSIKLYPSVDFSSHPRQQFPFVNPFQVVLLVRELIPHLLFTWA